MTTKKSYQIEPGTAALTAQLLRHCLNRRPQGFLPQMSAAEYAARVETAMEGLDFLAKGLAPSVTLSDVEA